MTHKPVIERLADLMEENGWFGLAYLAAALEAPEASVSARLRDLRKAGYVVDRIYVKGGGYAYRIA